MLKKILIFIFLLIIPFTSLKAQPKNIILMIGDGMGISAISAAKNQQKFLNLEKLNQIGFVNTTAFNNLITDSAASATAIATGFKTNNQMIGLDPKFKELKTVLEYAIEKNKSTGLVATSSITHATPASFISHVKSRHQHDEIALQISKSKIDVLIGGGLGYFLPKNDPRSLRKDHLNLIENFRNDYQIITSSKQFKKSKNSKKLFALLAQDGLPSLKNRQVSLKDMTDKALQILSNNPQGFFLMIEGSQIDWHAHENLAHEMIDEIIDFDQAVGLAYQFAKKDQQTLIIVTSDHETGGFEITKADKNKITKMDFISKKHTAQMVGIFSYGPNAEKFTGWLDNTDIGKNLIDLIKH